MASKIRTSGTIFYSLLSFTSWIGLNRLKYLYSVISVIDKRLPGITKKWTIAAFVDDKSSCISIYCLCRFICVNQLLGPILCDFSKPKFIWKRWVWKGGFPHLSMKAEISKGGWWNFWGWWNFSEQFQISPPNIWGGGLLPMSKIQNEQNPHPKWQLAAGIAVTDQCICFAMYSPFPGRWDSKWWKKCKSKSWMVGIF